MYTIFLREEEKFLTEAAFSLTGNSTVIKKINKVRCNGCSRWIWRV
jgi:hypothetical protein